MEARSTVPLVSVIIPFRNRAGHLMEAIQSGLDQTYPRVEIVAVDDGSTDDAADRALRLPGVVCVRQEPRGRSVARNKGISESNGELIALLDSDDLWSATKLERQVRALQERPEFDGVFGHVDEFVSPEAADVARLRPPRTGVPGLIPTTLLIRRRSFLRVGWFDPERDEADWMDWYGRAVEAGLRFHMLPDVVARRRMHATSALITDTATADDYMQALRSRVASRRRLQR